MPRARWSGVSSGASGSDAVAAGARLVGLDVARALALLGMVATHVIASRTPAGEESLAHVLASGRASALFAVLAGVSVALLTGRRTPVRGSDRWRAVGGLAARALLVALLGLWLGGLETGIAVILTYYGVLFLLGLPFVGLQARTLAVLAGVWLVVAPVLSHDVRPDLPERGYDSPTFADLETPGLLLSELLLTGYYPVLPWLAYLLAGMAVGRSDLGRRAVQVALLAGGAVLALAARGLSAALTADRFTTDSLDRARTELAGTTPTNGSWEWLLVDAPHSGTPFDLAHTIGTALAVIGLCLLLVGLLPEVEARFVAVLFGAGTMTLSLYSLHLVMRTPAVWPPEDDAAFRVHVLVLATVGAAVVARGWRGPLELVVGLPGRLLRRNRSRAAYVGGT